MADGDVVLMFAENNPQHFCDLLSSTMVLADDLGLISYAAIIKSSTSIETALNLIKHYDRGVRLTAVQTLAHYMNLKEVKKAMEEATRVEMSSPIKKIMEQCLNEPSFVDLN